MSGKEFTAPLTIQTVLEGLFGVYVTHLQWSSPKPPKPDPDSPSDLQRRGTSNGLMTGHAPSLNHHHHHAQQQQQQQAATSSSSRLAVQASIERVRAHCE